MKYSAIHPGDAMSSWQVRRDGKGMFLPDMTL